MKGAITIFNWANIPIKIHWSFAFLIAYALGLGISAQFTWHDLAIHSCFVLAVFGCVVLHELGHAITARHHGVITQQIVILPLGGVAIFEPRQVKPLQELQVAAAGPIVNFIIALLLWISLQIFVPDSFSYIGVPNQILSISTTFAERLLWINLIIGAFNLLPTLPLDGGVMLRAILTHYFSRLAANRAVFFISMTLAIGFVFYSYYYHAVEYLLFAWFIYFSARKIPL